MWVNRDWHLNKKLEPQPTGDPQALNDFLHGTSEQLETEDLLINAAGTDSSLFTDSTHPALTVSVERCVVTQLTRQRFQEQLRCHQSSVMDPDCTSAFVSLQDTLCRLLPYHACVGTLPSTGEFHIVDEQFGVVSSLLLKRTQEMLSKYRLLLLQEARGRAHHSAC
ncbi:UNVERIFIED_CONTAM: hypothetical protein FKN15_065643 [Acipenser sinensis]